ncbi:MAG: hypothetical protein K8T89_03185, partial [Planctomycetes bacterium]|nr:hypothetical protein [Planctomycetota bacterium]
LVRGLILVGAILAILILVVNALGLIFTYLTWLGSSPSVGNLLAAVIMGGIAFSVCRWIIRRKARRTKEYPDSVKIMLLRQRKPIVSLPIWCAIGVAAIGYFGSLADSSSRLAVGSLECGGRRAVPVLLHLAEKGDQRTRTDAVRSLMHLGPDAAEAIPWLVQQVKPDRDIERIGKSALFKAIGPAAAPALIEAAIRENEPERKKVLIEQFMGITPNARADFEQVMRVLNSKDEKQIELGLRLLTRCDLQPRDVGLLINWLVDQGKFKLDAVKALVPVASACTPHLDKLMRLYRASEQCAYVPELFAGMGEPAVVPLMREMSSAPTNDAKYNDLVEALGRIGPPAAPARDELRKAAESKFYNLRFEAEIALAKIDGDSGSALIILLDAAFKGENYNVRSAGIGGLISLMSESARALPRCIEMIQNGTENQQHTAFNLIERWGKIGAPAVEAICNYLEADSYPDNREAALRALKAIGPGAAPAEATLRKVWPRLPIRRQFDAAITQRAITGNADLLSDLVMQHSREELDPVRAMIDVELERAVEALGLKSKGLMPAIDKAHAYGILLDYQYQNLVQKIDPWAARLNDPDLWGQVFFGVLLLCLLVETFVFRWHKGWWPREKRKSAIPEQNPFESDSKT